MIPYNSILNDNWYARLMQQVRESSTAGVRATGSQADDPFWKARAAQGLGDLAAARQDAWKQARDQAMAQRAAAQARGRDYQSRATWGLKNMNPQAGPDTYLGTQPEAAILPGIGSELAQEPAVSAMSAPGAYGPTEASTWRLPRSAGAYMPYRYRSPAVRYNPKQFENPLINRRKNALDEYYADLAKGW